MKWPWNWNRKPPTPENFSEQWDAFVKAKIDREARNEAGRLSFELRKVTELVVRVADLERKISNADDALTRFGKRCDKIEAMRTPNQQLAEGFEQIIRKLATMDSEKQALADQTRKLYDVLTKSPDWLFASEQKEATRNE